MKFKRNYFSLYFTFTLVFIYAIQDFLTSRNTTGEIALDRGLTHVSLFAIIFFLATYFFYSTMISRRIMISSINFILWSIAGWILFVNVFQGTISWSMAIQLGLSALWIFTYHLFSSYLRRFPQSWTLILVGITIMFGLYSFSVFYASYTIGDLYDSIAVINLVYSVLVFLPWITLVPSKTMRRLFFLLALIVVLISMKRGAFLVFPVMLLTSIFVEAVVCRRIYGPMIRVMFLFVLFFAGILVADQLSDGYLSSRFLLEEISSGSGRMILYGTVIESLSQASLWSLFLGHGSGAVEELLGVAAHNEWLEFIYNYGIVGVFFYAALFFTLGHRLVKLIRQSSRFASGYAMAIVYLFVVGLFGQIYFTHSTFYIMAFLGAVEGLMIKDAQDSRVRSVNCNQRYKQGME
jgi:hypothetical protein